MSILSSLVNAYDRMSVRHEIAPFGYSSEKIGFLITLNPNGSPASDPIDLRDGEGRKRQPRPMAVPQPAKRTSGVSSNFLWDKTSYALGVTSGEGKRTTIEHNAFRARHKTALVGTNDEGLQALLRFIERWTPDQFETFGWPEAMKDQNIIFALESDRLDNVFLHDRQAARDLWARLKSETLAAEAACLVTGLSGPVARLHPAIKGVWGAQSSGASLVSFNLDAFTSYGHEQGDNAPVSEAAAFAYTAVLNKFLESDSRNRLQVGDASTVFWADASSDAAKAAEQAFGSFFNENVEAEAIRTVVDKLRQGQPIDAFRPDLNEGVRFHILGLAPNAARLSIRFYVEDDFGAIATRYSRFVAAMRIDPPPKDENPSLWRLLVETASQRKSDNIPPNLAGEWLRAILTGAPYPLTLRSTILMRLRADKDVSSYRVAMLKAVEVSRKNEVPVSLDSTLKDPGYLLGRLFATYEYVQIQALGAGVNATIRDQYYGTASATPRAVFPLLQRKATHHLSRLRKDAPGRARFLDQRLGEIFELAAPEALFVPTLTAPRQALFAVGYYHQRNHFYRTKPTETEAAPIEEPAL